MPRRLRIDKAGYAYHVINRANARIQIFRQDSDYQAFEQVLRQACEQESMRLLAYCLMPNHWHLVLLPRQDGDLSRFMTWLTMTHTQRWHAYHKSVGSGHLYQGRYKSFPIQTDEHFLTVCRYVERNARQANLVRKAQNWRWCSLWLREHPDCENGVVLSDWPIEPTKNWSVLVNQPFADKETQALRNCIQRDRPFGSGPWLTRMVRRFSLESTIRPRGRPRRQEKKGAVLPKKGS